MALINDAKVLKQYIFEHPESIECMQFVLAHAPYCAKHMNSYSEDGKIFMDILNQMFQKHEYAIPFYYIGYLRLNSQNTSAADCKAFLRSMCNDLDRITKWFKFNGCCTGDDPEYLNIITPNMIAYIKTFITCVRKHQLETGANESAMLNYAPMIPYNYIMSRDTELSTDSESSKVIQEAINSYDYICDGPKKCRVLSSIAIQFTNEIIEYIDLIFNQWKCPMDIFTTFTYSNYGISNEVKKYLMYIWLLNQQHFINHDELLVQYRDFSTFRDHRISPLKKDEFNQVFESMCKYNTGDIADMMTVEAWSALSDESQEAANKYLENSNKGNVDETYDLDALLAEFYTMRHVETNDYTNQFFLAEIPGININSYNYINDTIMICEINSNYLVIPYVDIACDYKLRIIGIDKSGEIHIWDDLEAINEM